MQTVTTWRELDDAIASPPFGRHAEHTRSTLVFRGLARGSYTNTSSLARLTGDFSRLERHLMRNFRKYAHKEAPGPTEWDWMALGQHHGLPTRLLDWTFSPLVALHFATASWPDDDAILWAVDVAAVHRWLPGPLRESLGHEGSLMFTTELLARHATGLGQLDRLGANEETFALFFEPPALDERIANQAAVLSLISDPTCHMQDWLAAHEGTAEAWRIPAELKAEIRERLDQAHVNERVLMPGLDGLAAWLRRYYSPRAALDVRDQGGSMDGSDARAQTEGSMA
jgi:FRG domain